MKLTFLGTGSMVPTKERNVVSHFLEYGGDGFLIDCGEGTQRQMNMAGINRLRVNHILITHWHGDHVSGLIGLLQTISNSENPKPIKVFGPTGTKENLARFMKATMHNSRLQLEVKELEPKGVEKFYETDSYHLECTQMDHPVPTLAYRFVEKDKTRADMEKAKKLGLKQGPLIGKLLQGKTVDTKGKKINPKQVIYVQEGKRIAFVLDTAINENCYEIAENADLLVCESTFEKKEEDKAKEYKHLTSTQAANIAKKAGAKKLILTHFSQRYNKTDKLLEQAQKIFPNTKAANDFMEVEF